MIYYVILGVILFVSFVCYIFMQNKLNKYFDIKTKYSGFEVCKKILDSKKSNMYVVTTFEDVSNYVSFRHNAIKLSKDTFDGDDLVNICLSCFISFEIFDKKLFSRLFKVINYIIRICYIFIILGLVLKDSGIIYATVLILLVLFIYQIISFVYDKRVIMDVLSFLDKDYSKEDLLSVLNIIRYKEFSLFLDTVLNIIRR